VKTFKNVGDQLGFEKSESLYKLLDIPVEDYDENYTNLEKWKTEIASTLEIV
jgi:hypothetical protein